MMCATGPCDTPTSPSGSPYDKDCWQEADCSTGPCETAQRHPAAHRTAQLVSCDSNMSIDHEPESQQIFGGTTSLLPLQFQRHRSPAVLNCTLSFPALTRHCHSLLNSPMFGPFSTSPFCFQLHHCSCFQLHQIISVLNFIFSF